VGVIGAERKAFIEEMTAAAAIFVAHIVLRQARQPKHANWFIATAKIPCDNVPQLRENSIPFTD
jgi:hypothetical protein